MGRFSRWIRQYLPHGKVAHRRSPSSYRPRLEILEDRLAPSATGFGDPVPGILTGLVYVDVNGNNVRDNNEVGLPGVAVTLTKASDNSVVQTTTTDANGTYTFFQVLPGSYNLNRGGVSASVDAFLDGKVFQGNLGGTAATNAINTINLASGQSGTDYQFRVSGLAPQVISLRQFLASSTPADSFLSLSPPGLGIAFGDNSVQPNAAFVFPTQTAASLSGSVINDSTNLGIAAVPVELSGLDYTGKAVKFTSLSNDSGVFTFSSIQAGTYTLNVLEQPDGFRAGLPTVGTFGSVVTGVAFRNDQIGDIQISAGGTGNNYTFTEHLSTPLLGGNLSAELADDTGSSVTDGVTSDPTVVGAINTANPIVSFRAGFDSTLAENFVDILGSLTGLKFLLNPALLAQIFGGLLTDAAHTLHLQATDSAGQTGSVDVPFTLNATAPATPTLVLNPDPLGNGTTDQSNVNLAGTTTAGARVELIQNGAILQTTTAAAGGTFDFNGVGLTLGPNNFTARATDLAGNVSQFKTFFVLNQAPTAPVNPINQALTLNIDKNVDLSGVFGDADLSTSQIVLNTTAGKVNLQMLDNQAPQTVANFFNYINSGAYTNDLFHRNGTNGTPQPGGGNLGLLPVLQGGGFTFTGATITSVTPNPNIPNEFNATRSNVAGTVAMAKGSTADSASSQFFFNLSDNSTGLDNVSNAGGFTVFAKVVSGADQRVVNTLAAIPVSNQLSFNGAFGALPLQDYTNSPFPTGAVADNFALISSVQTVKQSTEKLTFSNITTDNAAVVTATFNANAPDQLVLHPTGAGTATVTVTATDRFGATTTASFSVTVSA